MREDVQPGRNREIFENRVDGYNCVSECLPCSFLLQVWRFSGLILMWRGAWGREPVRIGGGRGKGGRRRKGGKRDTQSGENREKRRKNSQYCVTFYNRNRTNGQEHLRKRAVSGCKRYRRQEFQTPLSPPRRCLGHTDIILVWIFVANHSKGINHFLTADTIQPAVHIFGQTFVRLLVHSLWGT